MKFANFVLTVSLLVTIDRSHAAAIGDEMDVWIDGRFNNKDQHGYSTALEDTKDCSDDEKEVDGVGVIDPRMKKPCRPEPKPYVPVIEKPKCGHRSPFGLVKARISSPTDAESKFGAWPWMAIVLKIVEDKKVYVSGGVLIDHWNILTTAHSIVGLKTSEIRVRLGEYDTQSDSELLPHRDYTVAKVNIHPEFNSKSLHNDIAVITLEDMAIFKEHISPICLSTEKPRELLSYSHCVVTGFGKDALIGGSYATKLKALSLPYVPHDQCQRALRKTRLGDRFKLHESFVCAGGRKGEDSCKGDGGSPLVCRIGNDDSKGWILVGLVSWGIDCGVAGVPGVYTNVAEFLKWIPQHTGIPIEDYAWIASETKDNDSSDSDHGIVDIGGFGRTHEA